MRITQLNQSRALAAFALSFCLLLTCNLSAQFTNADYLYDKAVSFQEEKDLHKAEEYLTLTINDNPNYTDAFLRRSEVYYRLEQFNKALDDLNTVIHENPYHVDAIELRATVHFAQKNYKAALDDYNLMQSYHRSAEGYLQIGLTLAAMRHYDDAVAAYRAATEMNPLLAEAYCGIADVLVAKGAYNYNEAFTYYEKALLYNPDDYVTLNNRGMLYMLVENYDAAIRDFKASTAVEADYQAHLCLAQCYLENQQWKEAHRAIARAAELNYEHPEVYFTFGLIELTTGKYEAALNSFLAAQNYDADNPNYIKYAGIAEYNLGEPYEAITTFNTYLNQLGTEDEEVNQYVDDCYARIEKMSVSFPETKRTQTMTPAESKATNDIEPMRAKGFSTDIFDR